MTGLDGLSTLKKIKAINPLIPIIMITKNEEEWLMDEAIASQISDYLIKPVNPNQIFLSCKKILSSDKILVMRKGRLIEQGSHKELRSIGGLYSQLADLQEKGLTTI